MPIPEDQLKATKLRLQAQLENIAFTLANAPLSEEQKAILQLQLSSVQAGLVRLTAVSPSDISASRVTTSSFSSPANQAGSMLSRRLRDLLV